MNWAAGRKPDPNHQRVLEALDAMAPKERLAQAFRLGERVRRLFRAGLRQRFPELSEPELHQLYLELWDRCHNRNY